MKFGLKKNDSGVYMIKNLSNGKIYIGSAISLRERLSHHFHLLKNNKHHSIHLQNAWNKQNGNYFICGVICYVQDKSQLVVEEQKYIDTYNSANSKFGYNICPIARSNLGCKQTRGMIERSAKMMGSLNHFYNKKHTPDALFKISESNIQKILTNKDIDNIKHLWNTGNYTQVNLGKMFNIGQPYISRIVNNKKRNKIYQPCQDLRENN